MGDVLNGDVLLVKAKQLFGSQRIMNTFYVQASGIAPETDALVMSQGAFWLTGAYDPLQYQLSNLWDDDTVEFYNVTQDRPMGEVPYTYALAGQLTDRPMPNQMACLVTFPTGVKRSLGKKYIAGLTDTNNRFEGAISAAFQALLATWGADILAGFTAGTLDFVPGNWSAFYNRFAPYISAIVEVVQATQRRRKVGVGE